MSSSSDSSVKAMRHKLVLTKISKFLPLEEVCRLRLTCSAWNSGFVQGALRSAPLLHFRNDARLGQFLDTMEASPLIPFGGYKLVLEDGMDYPVYLQFFPLLGPTLNRLTLSITARNHGNGIDMAPLRKAIFDQCPNLVELELELISNSETPAPRGQPLQLPEPRNGGLLPKLKALNLVAKGLNSELLQRQTILLMTDLILGAVNLEELRLGTKEHVCSTCHRIGNALPTYTLPLGMGGGGSEAQIYSGVLAIFSNNEATGGHLKTLDMRRLKNVELRTLAQLSRRSTNPLNRLRDIRLHFGRENVYQDLPRLLHELLSAQAASLEVLSVAMDLHQDKIRIPHLGRLRHLALALPWGEGPQELPIEVDLDGASFALNFPNLKALYFSRGDLHGQFTPSIVDGVQDTLHFHWKYPARVWHTFHATVPKLCALFPSVKRLDVRIDGDNLGGLLKQIWATWSRLEALKVTVTGSGASGPVFQLDSIITGIPDSQFLGLAEAIAEGQEAVEALQRKLAELKTTPGISDLKELREFEIVADGGAIGPLPVSEISYYFGYQAPGSKLEVGK